MNAARAAWRSYIVGETAVIDRLTDIFAGTDLEIVRDGDNAYMHGPAFDTARSANDARALSQTLLPRVNAALRLDDVTWVPVKLADRLSDGAGPVTVFAEAHIVGRSRLTAGGDPGPRVRAATFAHADANVRYAAALELFGSSADLKWVDLYKVYELLLDAADGDLPARTGVSANQISAFTQSANDAGVSGADARHAIPKKQPPRRTMTLPRAREFISTMLRTWS
jgi:hypothetical protein